jgi:C4-dicarboxylate-specific signal transduction histidine kinase
MVLDLATDLAPVLGSAPDLGRLCTFLLTNAVTAAGPARGKVAVQTAQQGDKLLLRIHDSGPEVPETLLGQLFEPGSVCRRGTNSLELAACNSLVRRLKGKIYAENDRQGGVAFIVELPAASSKLADTPRS